MSHPCERLVSCVQYLQQAGLSQEQLTRLHHCSLRGHSQSFAAVLSYFSSNKDLRQANSLFLLRVEYVTREHKRGGQPLDSLLRDALRLYPLRG